MSIFSTKTYVSPKDQFLLQHKDLSERDLNLELLYWQKLELQKLELIRSNLSTIVWVIAISIILSIFAVLGSIPTL